MAGNYEALKQTIDSNIKQNGAQQITGPVLNSVLNQIVSSIGANATFAGIATPDTDPGTPDQNVFYIASENGTYSNFNNLVIPDLGVFYVISNGQGAWTAAAVVMPGQNVPAVNVGYGLNPSGQIVESETERCTDYTYIYGVSKILVTTTYAGKSVWFYDKDKNPLSGITGTHYQEVIDVPDGAYYVVVSGFVGQSLMLAYNYNEILKNVNETLNSYLDKIVMSYPVQDVYSLNKGHYIAIDSAINPFVGYMYTSPIPVKKGDLIIARGKADGVAAISTCDSSGNNIQAKVIGAINDTKTRIFSYSVVEDGYVIVSLSYEDAYLIGHITKKDYALLNSELVIAGANSRFMKTADLILDGENDSDIINQVISLPWVNSVYFTPDSEISLKAELLLKSDFKLHSDGAKLTIPIAKTYTLSEAQTSWAILKVSSPVTDIVAGSYIEAKSGSLWITGYVSSLSDDKKTIYLTNQNSPNIGSGGLPAGATVRNVSSAICMRNSSNVVVEGINIDLNYIKDTTNSQSPDTWWAQNGFNVDKCTYVTIKDVVANNGGRHGVIFNASQFCKVLNCNWKTWGEHCIDLYTQNLGATPYDDNKNIVDGCICENAEQCGIQNHSGTGAIITNCIIINNEQSGIYFLEGAKNNIISNCIIKGNGTSGIEAYRDIENISVSNCRIENNGNGIYLHSPESKENYYLRFNNNIISNNDLAVKIFYSQYIDFVGNAFNSNNGTTVFDITNYAEDLWISCNTFNKGTGTVTVGVTDDNTCSYIKMFGNRFINISDSSTLVGSNDEDLNSIF